MFYTKEEAEKLIKELEPAVERLKQYCNNYDTYSSSEKETLSLAAMRMLFRAYHMSEVALSYRRGPC